MASITSPNAAAIPKPTGEIGRAGVEARVTASAGARAMFIKDSASI